MTAQLQAAPADPPAFNEVLDRLCPMHTVLDRRGTILHAGPTLRKLRPGEALRGRRVFDILETTHPAGLCDVAAVIAATSRRHRLRLRLRDAPKTTLQGMAVPLSGGGAILNLSFGISILEALQQYSLTGSDFAATDPTVEMLFVVEAKSAAMEASRGLTRQLQRAKAMAEYEAATDLLTGLANRRALDHVLARMTELGQEFALMHVDLDFFKEVNDTLGHAAGDHVLENVARIMTEETRAEDVVARVGGDEFVLVFHNLCDRERLEEIARRLIRRLEEPTLWQGQTCQISASLGTVLSIDYAQPRADWMLADADAALYSAKRAGRGRHCFHNRAGQQSGSPLR
ncbi:GGDEF domain-containing protein [Pseudooceanicola sp. C21-150M6]|uniref:GGDEF domain-containing protein n=1 Tax=Pseudooceanicola sp. C21-150M6 TaxID=3434355 RepID=UPI003D7FAF8B